MLRPRSPLFNAATDAPDAGGSGDAQPKATIGQQLRAALSSKTELTAKLDTATTSLQSVTAERDSAHADLATAKARITELESQLGEVTAALGDHQKEVEKLKSAEQDISKRASTQAKAIVQSVGIEASQLPAPDEGIKTKDVPQSEAALETALAACKTQKERSELLRSYRAQN